MNEETSRNKRKPAKPSPDSTEELDNAASRLRLRLEGDWTTYIPEKDAESIRKLLNRMATTLNSIVAAESQEQKKKISASIFQELMDTFYKWASAEVPESYMSVAPKLASQVEVLKERAALLQQKDQYNALLKTETTKTKGRDNDGVLEKSTQSKLEKFAKQLEEICDQTNYLKQLINQRHLSIESEISRSRMYTGENISRVLKEIMSFTELIKVLEPRLLERFLQIDTQLAALRESLGSKNDIQDSLGILNVRAEIEKHVTAEIISNISKVLMPTIESLQISTDKTATECLDMIKSQCLKAGLIPLERLY